ncbi:MAG: hypothetical protein HUU29_11340 [Planctomycetaceae bacterium]|nr:hypothetical protein [Planctomycetaceae bacterium]
MKPAIVMSVVCFLAGCASHEFNREFLMGYEYLSSYEGVHLFYDPEHEGSVKLENLFVNSPDYPRRPEYAELSEEGFQKLVSMVGFCGKYWDTKLWKEVTLTSQDFLRHLQGKIQLPETAYLRKEGVLQLPEFAYPPYR